MRLYYILAAVLAILGAGARAWYRRWKNGRTIARLEAEKRQAQGRADVAIANREATVIVDERQAAGRDRGEAARTDAAVVEATTPNERIDAATAVLRRRKDDAAAKVRRLAGRPTPRGGS